MTRLRILFLAAALVLSLLAQAIAASADPGDGGLSSHSYSASTTSADPGDSGMDPGP